jgi:hypothetical protein
MLVRRDPIDVTLLLHCKASPTEVGGVFYNFRWSRL